MSFIDELKTRFDTLEPDRLFIPAWDRYVYFEPFTLRQRIEVKKLMGKSTADADYIARTITTCALDENGERIFDDGDWFHLYDLGVSTELDDLFFAICKHLGERGRAEEEEKKRQLEEQAQALSDG